MGRVLADYHEYGMIKEGFEEVIREILFGNFVESMSIYMTSKHKAFKYFEE